MEEERGSGNARKREKEVEKESETERRINARWKIDGALKDKVEQRAAISSTIFTFNTRPDKEHTILSTPISLYTAACKTYSSVRSRMKLIH